MNKRQFACVGVEGGLVRGSPELHPRSDKPRHFGVSSRLMMRDPEMLRHQGSARSTRGSEKRLRFRKSRTRNRMTQVEQQSLSFDIFCSRIRIPNFLVKEIPSGNCRGRFVARREPDLHPVRLVDIVGRTGSCHPGGDPSPRANAGCAWFLTFSAMRQCPDLITRTPRCLCRLARPLVKVSCWRYLTISASMLPGLIFDAPTCAAAFSLCASSSA